MRHPPNPVFATWDTERKYIHAGRLVVHKNWSQSRAAAEVGISRSRLNEWLQQHTAELQAEIGTVIDPEHEVEVGRNKDPHLRIVRRVPPVDEFYEHYFGHWVCPDCQKHHEDPAFHREIRRAIRDPEARRVIVSLPPYHSKSTEITIKDTIYDIVTDPNSRTLIISKADQMARAFLVSIKELLTNRDLYVEGKNLIDDWGPFAPGQFAANGGRTEGWTSTHIYVAQRTSHEKDPTVAVAGVGNQIASRRATKIKFDDIATLANQSGNGPIKMLEWIDKEALSRIGRSGIAIWANTRVLPGDIYETLGRRPGYKTISYPCIIDDETGEVLWPDHFPYEDAVIRRAEMNDQDWMMTYQQISTGGANQDFDPLALEAARDKTRTYGHFERHWYIVGGLDLAGAGPGAGYTSAIIKAIDPETMQRYYIEGWNVKSMKPHELKNRMLEVSERIPIAEWRVERNGLQDRVVQYENELITKLASMGVKVTAHHTGSNKWDRDFGVASMAPAFAAHMVSVPWGDETARTFFQMLFDQLLQFPYGVRLDMAHADWFADIGLREGVRRKKMPMFVQRRVPDFVARHRRIYRPKEGTIERVKPEDQRRAMLGIHQAQGRPLIAAEVRGEVPPEYEGPDPEVL